MVAIREKKLAYKHPNLCELQSKQKTKFFLHPRVQLVWIEKAAELGTKVILKEISKSVLKVIMMAKLEQILIIE